MMIGVIALVVVVLALLALGLWLDAIGEEREKAFRPGAVGSEDTRALLLRLLTEEYGDEGWAEHGSLRRITFAVNAHFERTEERPNRGDDVIW